MSCACLNPAIINQASTRQNNSSTITLLNGSAIVFNFAPRNSYPNNTIVTLKMWITSDWFKNNPAYSDIGWDASFAWQTPSDANGQQRGVLRIEWDGANIYVLSSIRPRTPITTIQLNASDATRPSLTFELTGLDRNSYRCVNIQASSESVDVSGNPLAENCFLHGNAETPYDASTLCSPCTLGNPLGCVPSINSLSWTEIAILFGALFTLFFFIRRI